MALPVRPRAARREDSTISNPFASVLLHLEKWPDLGSGMEVSEQDMFCNPVALSPFQRFSNFSLSYSIGRIVPQCQTSITGLVFQQGDLGHGGPPRPCSKGCRQSDHQPALGREAYSRATSECILLKTDSSFWSRLGNN